MIDNSNLSLGLDLPLPVSTWHEDETLYSLCSRFHFVSGNALSGATALQLFGHRRYGTQHDFASRINVFVQRTHGRFGAAAPSVIRKHTILPFYLPWRPVELQNRIIGELSAGNASRVKSWLGLPASRIRANHPLKACPMCMQEDRERFGVGYWHLRHQLPGVWMCSAHDCLLHESIQKSTGVGRFLWFLPHEGDLKSPNLNLRWAPTKRSLHLLEAAALATYSLPSDEHIDPARLAATYREALLERRLLRGATHVALEDAASQYHCFARDLRLANLGLPIPSTVHDARQQMSRIFSPTAQPTHPLRHFLMILWLFDGWEDFWRTYQNTTSNQMTHHLVESVPQVVHSEKRKLNLLHLVEKEGYTLSRAAREVGIAVYTAQAWASEKGLPVVKRPRLSRETISAVKSDLRRGREPSYIADRHELSVQTVKRMLKTDLRLFERWLQANTALRLSAMRRTWLRTIKRHPHTTLKGLRKQQPRCYAWLYRNDKGWLTESLALVPKYQQQPSMRVNWSRRDTELVELLSGTIDGLATANTSQPVTMQQMYQLLPQIKPYLNKLDRLPLTKSLCTQIRRRALTP